MFDNLFGFAGPVGTAFVLVAILFSCVAYTMLGGRMTQLSAGRRARV